MCIDIGIFMMMSSAVNDMGYDVHYIEPLTTLRNSLMGFRCVHVYF